MLRGTMREDGLVLNAKWDPSLKSLVLTCQTEAFEEALLEYASRYNTEADFEDTNEGKRVFPTKPVLVLNPKKEVEKMISLTKKVDLINVFNAISGIAFDYLENAWTLATFNFKDELGKDSYLTYNLLNSKKKRRELDLIIDSYLDFIKYFYQVRDDKDLLTSARDRDMDEEEYMDRGQDSESEADHGETGMDIERAGQTRGRADPKPVKPAKRPVLIKFKPAEVSEVSRKFPKEVLRTITQSHRFMLDLVESYEYGQVGELVAKRSFGFGGHGRLGGEMGSYGGYGGFGEHESELGEKKTITRGDFAAMVSWLHHQPACLLKFTIKVMEKMIKGQELEAAAILINEMIIKENQLLLTPVLTSDDALRTEYFDKLANFVRALASNDCRRQQDTEYSYYRPVRNSGCWDDQRFSDEVFAG
jgi:hypothetical protein